MRLARELGLFGSLFRAAVVLVVFGAVGLFDRMRPAIHGIVADNVPTLVAAEEMLAVLADPGLEPDEVEERFGAAVVAAQARYSEPGEQPLLVSIEQRWRSALSADARSSERVRLIEQIRALAAVNRRAMVEADEEARRLGAAGAWGAALLGLALVAASLWFSGRLDARVLQPLAELEAVAVAAEAGEVHRRASERGPPELRRVTAAFNRMLDQRGVG